MPLKESKLRFSTLAVLTAAGLSFPAYGFTCMPQDWDPRFCDVPIASEARCAISANNWIARSACVNETEGCAAIGGCFGNTPNGHWYPVVELGVVERCQCASF